MAPARARWSRHRTRSLYGTTERGGAHGRGTVFRIAPTGQVTVLHSFVAAEGGPPVGLLRTSDGRIYGTTLNESTDGAAFTVDPETGAFSVLHQFNGAVDTAFPGQLIEGSDGHLYAGSLEGLAGMGSLFRMDRDTGQVTPLYTFEGGAAQGNYFAPHSLVQGPGGVFYGTAIEGGAFGRGTLFKVDAAGTFTLLHSFRGAPDDGALPSEFGRLLRASDGNLYGTTFGAGPSTSARSSRWTPCRARCRSSIRSPAARRTASSRTPG